VLSIADLRNRFSEVGDRIFSLRVSRIIWFWGKA
jgi:hypothetical protein